MAAPDLHVALIWPEIPWNTGNTARSCLAFGAQLHLVAPLGFSLEASAVKRAGLDYWEHVHPVVHRDLDAFLAALPALGTPWLLTAEAERTLHDAPLAAPSVFLLGCESAGLPRQIRDRHREQCLRIPQAHGVVRSLNQSTAAAIALAEFRRRHPLP
ncbi:MAG: tRNA (uridine(34)/cytosine(34)/5-carboxymethylaminomethyluridine(34)-2'-O)-methyltransferase TrmL [Planctomycetes bacterium]|nr:tRNA (uridine(34)/cytosine(34)/5-carboxymethylaminomethyluridine(34)-2'-O)-methyltransferase TrmL [Planctomycetota bacterium]